MRAILLDISTGHAVLSTGHAVMSTGHVVTSTGHGVPGGEAEYNRQGCQLSVVQPVERWNIFRFIDGRYV